MDIRQAVKNKAEYHDIVTYFQTQKEMSMDLLVLLIDTIEEMSEEIFEHYHALELLCRDELRFLTERAGREGGFDFLTQKEKEQLAYVLEKACSLDVVLAEKYRPWAAVLNK